MASYTRFYPNWKDWPDVSTPATAAAFQHIESGLITLNSSLNVFNVQDSAYGAKGDSATDDTVAIQAALTACRTSSGGIVYFPPGTYRTTANLVVGSNTFVWGAGEGASIIRRDSTSSVVQVLINFDTSGYTDHDIHVRWLTVTRSGEAVPPTYPLDNAIQLIGVTRASIRECRVQGGAKSIHMYGCVHWWVADNVCDTFVDNGIACNPIGSNTIGYGWIVNNKVDTPVADGFSLGSSSILNGGQSVVHCIGNSVTDAASQAIEYGGPSLDSCRIAGNISYWTGKANVNNNILVHCDALTNLSLDNNQLNHGSINITVDTVATKFSHRVHGSGNRVNGGGISYKNIIDGSSSDDRCYQGSMEINSTDFDVFQPRVSNANGAGIYVRAQGGAPALARVRLHGPVCFANGITTDPYGIYIDGGDSIEIRDARCFDPLGAGGTQQYGLFINATTNYVDVDNDFSGNKTGPRAVFSSNPTQKGVAKGINGGSGTPQNAVTAPVGALFARTDGGATTTLYVKESGSGNTGWVAK